MSDDIVTRLRNYSGPIWQLKKDPTLLTDAMREIERLRSQLTLAYGRTCRCVNTEARDES